MRNEIKIGLLALAAIGMAFWGYKFIQGRNILSNSTTIYVYYDNAAGLTVGTPVTISGVGVGSIADLELNLQEQVVRVAIDLNKGVQIPKSAEAVVSTSSIMGGKTVELIYRQPCSGDDCVEDGDVIRGRVRGILASFLGDDAGSQYVDSLKGTVGYALDSLNQTFFGEDSDHPIARSSRDLAETMQYLKSASAELETMLQRSSGDISRSMNNLEAITATLRQERASIASVLRNADSVSQSLVDADIDAAVSEATESIRQLRGTLDNTDRAIAEINRVVEDINQGKGTLGRLINDEALYNRLDRVSRNADTLVNDLQERPYRYIPFKSRNRVLKFDRKDREREAELQEQQQENAATDSTLLRVKG